jgi:hypothetical protein
MEKMGQYRFNQSAAHGAFSSSEPIEMV